MRKESRKKDVKSKKERRNEKINKQMIERKKETPRDWDFHVP